MTPRELAVRFAGPIRARLHLPLEELAGGHTPRSRWAKEQLQGIASIDDRAELLKQVPQYLDDGIRAEYAKWVRWHRALPPEARSAGFYQLDQGERLRRVFVHDHAGRPEETSLAAWDVARVVHYAGLGWAAGYLSEAEAWRVIGRAATLALESYDSWAAYGRGFVYGRWFWVGYWDDGMKDTAAAIDGLLAAGGGWHDLPWGFDVEPLLTVEDAAAPAPTRSTWRAVRMFVDCPGCQLPILVREVADAVRCDGCGEVSEVAARDAWKHGAAPPEEAEDDDDDEEHDDDDDDVDVDDDQAAGLFVNLDDRIQRAIREPVPHAACAACAAPITADDARAGDITCACGAVTPVAAAPDWLREIDGQLRLVVGGPLTLGRPGGSLYLLRDEP